MRTPRLLLALLVALTAIFTTGALAEPPKIEHVIKLLQDAKESDHPVPLLEKARETLKDFHPAHPQSLKAGGVGQRRAVNIAIGENEKKRDALEAIEKAIKTAKDGGDVKPKIESAIAHTHSAG